MNQILNQLNSKCLKSAELLEIQQNQGLNYHDWFNMTKLIYSVSPYYAVKFSELSSKHNEESVYKINEFKDVDSKLLMTRCTTLGCDKDQIKECHKRVTEKGEEITNSPITFLMQISSDDLEHEMRLDVISQYSGELVKDSSLIDNLGTEEVMTSLLYLQKHHKNDFLRLKDIIVHSGDISKSQFNQIIKAGKEKYPTEITDAEANELANSFGFYYKYGGLFNLNGIKFAKFILEDFRILFDFKTGFRIYENGCFHPLVDNKMSRIIRQKLDEVDADCWNKKINNIIVDALQIVALTQEKLSKGENFINMKNGLFDLNDSKLKPHDEDIYSVSQVPYDYGEGAKAPNFIKYLRSTFCEDVEIIMLVQELMGYCLTREVKAEKFFILIGEGANGKSLFLHILKKLVGEDNVSAISLKKLEDKYSPAELDGKLINMPSENQSIKGGFNSETLKAIVSGDQIMGERKYQNPFFFTPYATQVFAMNRLVYIADKSHGLDRRIIIIPFDVIFDNEGSDDYRASIQRVDKDLKVKILNEMPGIFNFAVKGLRRLKENNYEFTKPEKVDELIENYKKDINPVYYFFKEEIEITNLQSRTSSKEIKAKFDTWCADNGFSKSKEMNIRTFLNEFRSTLKTQGVNYSEQDSNSEHYFRGINVKKRCTAIPTNFSTHGSKEEETYGVVYDSSLPREARKRPKPEKEKAVNEIKALFADLDDE